MTDVMARAARVRLAAFDVDGVMTDGSLYFSDAGESLKVFNARDGHGMRMLQEAGVTLAIITSRRAGAVDQRARNLGIDHVYQGVADKRERFAALLAELGLASAETAYMGDDVIDLPVLTRCGFAITVPDAPAAVLAAAHYVTRAGGGRGAVREACELMLQARGALDGCINRYLA